MNKYFGFVFFFFAISAHAQTFKISSPNGKIVSTFRINRSGIQYQVVLGKKVVIDWSRLSLTLDGKLLSNNLKVSNAILKDTTQQYDLVIGKTSDVVAAYRKLRIPIQERDAPHTRLNIVVCAFNEGIAFRYEFLGKDNQQNFSLNEEHDEFNLVGNPIAKVLQLPNYTSSHEGFYTTKLINSLPPNTLMDMPALFQLPDKTYVSITEAALLDYAGMYLINENGILRSKLSPLPSDSTVKVKGAYPHKSPWRVIMVSNNVGDFMESNMLTTLSPPNRINDVSWIKPGKTTFPWWNGNVVPDTLNAPGNNFVTQQYYIDFCKRNHIEYHSVVEYGLHQWYMDDGVGFQPGPHSDVTTPVPGLNMKEVCDYAHSLGVGVRVWVQWAALYPKIDRAFELFEQWGLSGMMIDFMDRDDQEMVNIQTEMLEKAAKHHLHIQFHGAYKPTGLSRTYPNEFTREGTLNYEVHKWGPPLPAEHDLDIVFTRALAGSTDYHLGGFRSVPDNEYRTQYTRPLMAGTRCHSLAMYMVLENALGMVCDYPDAYEGQPGFDFVETVPTTWDETKVIEARMDEYVVIARRKGKDWYMGSINNSMPREITIPLSFLSGGSFTGKIYRDGNNPKSNPNGVIIENKTVKSSDKLTIPMGSKGGLVIRFKSN